MEVILQQNFPALGYVGDTVKVKPGYARNYLIPRGLAVEASSESQRYLKHVLSTISAKRLKLRSEAQSISERLEKVSLEFSIKLGAGGKSFGSISVRDIEAQLKEKGFELDRRQIRLLEPIRKAGEYKVQVKLHSEVHASVPVLVKGEAPAPIAAAEGGEGRPERRRRSRKAASTESADVATDASADAAPQAEKDAASRSKE